MPVYSLPPLLSPALALGAISLATIGLAPAAHAQTLYVMNTTCSLQRMAPVPCLVEAEEVGNATEYRHRVGDRTLVYRVFDDPYVRIGANVQIINKDWVQEADRSELGFTIRSGIVVIEKNPTVADSSVI